IVIGFILMRLIMNIQRISPHQMVGVPQPPSTQTAAPPPQPQAQAQAPAPSVAVAPSVAPTAIKTPPPAVAEVPKKSPPPVATAAPSIAAPTATTPPVFANAKAAATASVAPKQSKEPEVRRAEPVRPEDLAKASATQTVQTAQKPAAAEGPNQVAIKPLKKPYIKVVVDNGSLQPALARSIAPSG